MRWLQNGRCVAGTARDQRRFRRQWAPPGVISTAILLSFAALLLFGGWVVAADLATRSLSALNGVLLSYVASLGLVGGYALVARNPISGSRIDVLFALLSGAFLATGTVAFYAALDRESIAIVSAIAALYFVVPVVVGVLYFDAQLSPTNVAGLGLAVVAVVLIAS